MAILLWRRGCSWPVANAVASENSVHLTRDQRTRPIVRRKMRSIWPSEGCAVKFIARSRKASRCRKLSREPMPAIQGSVPASSILRQAKRSDGACHPHHRAGHGESENRLRQSHLQREADALADDAADDGIISPLASLSKSRGPNQNKIRDGPPIQFLARESGQPEISPLKMRWTYHQSGWSKTGVALAGGGGFKFSGLGGGGGGNKLPQLVRLAIWARIASGTIGLPSPTSQLPPSYVDVYGPRPIATALTDSGSVTTADVYPAS
jgi:hypothetical protein